MFFKVIEPTYPETLIKSIMTLKGVKVSDLERILGLKASYVSNMLNGRVKLPTSLFDEICKLLDLNPQKIRDFYYLHFNEQGDLPQRGFRAYSERAQQAYEKAQGED